jgi:hypothetical protein
VIVAAAPRSAASCDRRRRPAKCAGIDDINASFLSLSLFRGCLGAMPGFFFDFFGNRDVVPGAAVPLVGRIAGSAAQFGCAVDTKPSVIGGR